MSFDLNGGSNVRLAKKIILWSAIALLVFFAGSLVYCEINTALHLEEFEGMFGYYSEEGWKRVIKYTDEYAEVYTVSSEGYNSFITYFEKNGSVWEAIYEKCAWSESGSADDRVWPYFWLP